MRRVALAALLVGVVACTQAFATPAWWNGERSVTRFEPATGARRTLVTAAPVRAVAPLPDGGAWIAYGDALVRVSADLSPAFAVASPGSPGGATFAAATRDGGVWLAQGDQVAHFDAHGVRGLSWPHSRRITAFAVAGPDAIWVADEAALHRYRSNGSLVSTHARSAVSSLLLDAAGGYLWVTTPYIAIQYDVLLGFEARARVALPAAMRAAAVHAPSGTLWLLGASEIVAYDRNGQRGPALAIPGSVADPHALAADAVADGLLVADLAGTSLATGDPLQWIRLTSGEATVAIAGSVQDVVPTLAIEAADSHALRLRYGIACGGVPCMATLPYLRALALHAYIADLDVADQFAVDRNAGTAALDIGALRDVAPPLRAWVQDAYGNRSAELSIAFADLPPAPRPKALPTVSITAPANNAKFVVPVTSIAITATAADSDGTVTKVEFYRGAVLLGTDTTSPYSYSWANPPIGTYNLTAKAYDNAGGVTTSAIVAIQVNANVAPTVTITAPANNAAYTAPATIAITANAADSDGMIAKVEFYQGTTRLNTDTAAPYAFTWTNVAGGTYTLTAKATDDKGAVTTSGAITVKVNAPPTVALTAPANNTTVVAPANVTINATAADSGGSVSKVEFFRNGTLLGTDTTSPYSYTWSNVPVGTYALTAKATDNLGATTVSAARTLTVAANQPPVVTLTAPANGANVVEGVPVVITATASDSDGTIANVKFYRNGSSLIGTDTSNPYSVTTTFGIGTHTLTSVATDNKGATTTSAPVAVTSVENQYPTVTLTGPLDNQVFPSATPPDITLTASASDPDGRIVNVKFYYLPAPTQYDTEPVRKLIGTVTTAPYRIVWADVPGTGTDACTGPVCSPDYYNVLPDYYDISAVATDDAGATTEAWARITVPNGTPWTIDLTVPTEGGVFIAPATVVIAASTGPPPVGVAVNRVEIIGNGSVIATLPPASDGNYAAAWRGLGAGTHSVKVRLQDAAGFTFDTYSRSVTVRDAATPPTINITAPPHEKRYRGLPNIDVAAIAADDDGSIAEVLVRPDDAFPGFSATGASVTATWTGVQDGIHVISAEATDNAGATGQAKPVFIEVLLYPRLQAVVLTSPAPGTTVTNPVVLTAEAGAPDGSLAGIEFYRGSTLVGTATSPPYRLVASTPAGSHAFTAKGIMLAGFDVTSTPVTVTVSGSNVTPSVTLTSPTAGQTFPVGSAVPLAATASDPDGSIARIEFTVAGSVVATATSAPYSATWTAATAGTYTVNARAVDNQGGTRLATAVSVTIGTNAGPTVSLTAPTNGQVFYAGVPFTIAATASDPGGSIAKVEFYAGTTLIGTDASAPYTLMATVATAGPVALTAKATDSSGAVTTSAAVNVTITANALPIVTLTSPSNGQAVVAGGTLELVASAADADGSIARVEFYDGTTLLATVTAAPYRFTWSNVPTGNHTLTARVVDSRGAATVSAPVTISAQGMSLTITSPATNASVGVDFVDVVGIYAAPANSGITVNGVVAALDGQGTFALGNIPLDAGANTLEVKLTTLSGETFTQTRTVTSTADAPFRVYADPSYGYAPMRIALRYTSRVASTITTYSIANLDGGILDTSQLLPGTLGYVTFNAPGVYQPRVTINYGAGLTYTQTLAIVVRDFAAMDQMFQSMFRDFVAALDSGNKPGAMQLLSGPMKDRFGPVIDVLAPSMSQILGTFLGFGGVAIGTQAASYALTRAINGRTRVYLIDLGQDLNGVWRFDSM